MSASVLVADPPGAVGLRVGWHAGLRSFPRPERCHPVWRIARGWRSPGHGRRSRRPNGYQSPERGLDPRLSVHWVHLDCALLGRGGLLDLGYWGATQVDWLDSVRQRHP